MSSDWIEDSPGPDVLDGPFTARDYAQFVQDSATERTLNRYGFVAGYARAWQQKVTQDYLVERVFEFDSASGPGYTLNWFKLGARTSKNFKRDLTALPQTNSYAVEMNYEGGIRSFRFYFVKGDLFFAIHLQTGENKDLSDSARGIAQTEFDMAPDATNVAATPSAISTTSAWVVGLASIALCFLIATVVFVAVRSARRQPAMLAMATGFQMSPDGASWWDGVRWHDARTEIPPNAQRSPDGVYWWDGRSWRRTGS